MSNKPYIEIIRRKYNKNRRISNF